VAEPKGAEWQVRSERELYTDRWLTVNVADVELPDGRRLDHRLIHMAPSAGVVILNTARTHVLLMWRHRFITNSRGWEIPMGALDRGEDAAGAALREAVEETGWQPAELTHLVTLHPSGGILDSTHHLFVAVGADHVGPPVDSFESDRVEWVPLADLVAIIGKGNITSGSTLTGLLYLLATQQVAPPPGAGSAPATG
jgi:8-oxo-dGTP pyrophosphatase MutT (NUDIX family)